MPEALIPSCASILRWHSDHPYGALTGALFDPCAGDGSAITDLRQLWTSQTRNTRFHLNLHAAEMETLRAKALTAALAHPRDHAICSDAFRLTWTGHATLLWLNPPYDHDPDDGRLELKFLKRFTPALAPAEGFLYFIVPQSILTDCADYLSRHYTHHRAWRFPAEHYDAYQQVVFVAKRAPRALAPNTARDTIAAWADFDHLDPLPEVCSHPFTLSGMGEFTPEFSLRKKTFDLRGTLAGHQPSCHLPEIARRDATQLLGAPSQTAVPPRAAHIALALASGVFNGLELTPDRPDLHPRILVKGVFVRELLKLEEKRNSKGELTGTVEVEQPKLILTVLRLDTYDFVELRAGVTPTGAEDLTRWNAADLLTFYQESLIDILGDQFPPLHDPRREDHRLQLPDLARSPYNVQAMAIQAALKLLVTGRSPFLLADVGTGKSTMALYIAAALSPQYHGHTLAELARLGYATHRGAAARRRPILPVVKRTLVLCPPHLLTGWTDQVKACLPEARVQILTELKDLDVDADVYILSSGKAKLGHAHRGLEGTCPGCGAPIATTAKVNVARRLTCPVTRTLPTNAWARLARQLATIIAPAYPTSAYVLTAGVEPAMLDKIQQPRNFPASNLQPILDQVLELFRHPPATVDQPHYWKFLEIIEELVAITQNYSDVADKLDIIAHDRPSYERNPIARLTQALRSPEPPAPGSANHPLAKILQVATFSEPKLCGERLYQAVPQPRRIPFARHIARYYRHRFQLMLLDEAHEYANERSAQTRAALRLIALPGMRTVVLTGSLMDGYSSSLFVLFWALSPSFREQFSFGDLRRFVRLYGYAKVFVPKTDAPAGKLSYGSQSDRQIGPRRRLGEAPGILPTFLLEHLLPTSILVHKSDLDQELPTLTETPVPLTATSETDLQIVAEYRGLLDDLLTQIKRDRFRKGRAGKLLGALLELPSYLDRSTEDCGPFTLAYPEALGGEIIATGRQFPTGTRTIKEQYLLDSLSGALDRGDRAVVFLRHTGGNLPKRLLRLITDNLTSSSFFLDAKRVSAKRREQYLNQHVIDPGVQVLIINPNCVRTGLNNLVAFSTAIWFETDYSSQTYLQANGRFHRIGQTRPVTILYPYWAGTAQEKAFHLIARKVTASLQVSGIDVRSALEAAGASEAANSLDTALAIGEALYQQLAA